MKIGDNAPKLFENKVSGAGEKIESRKHEDSSTEEISDRISLQEERGKKTGHTKGIMGRIGDWTKENITGKKEVQGVNPYLSHDFVDYSQQYGRYAAIGAAAGGAVGAAAGMYAGYQDLKTDKI